MNVDKMVAQLDELIEQYKDMLKPPRPENVEGSNTGRLLVSRLESAIERLSLPGSTYTRQLDLHREKRTKYKIHDVYSIAVGLRDDLKAGWTESVMELVHADTYGDYLKMADDLLVAHYKDPAAVITGTTLEVHVRALCAKYGVDTDLPSGAPKKADVMNADLQKAGAYDGLQQKQVTAWMDLRNKAAHGNYPDYDEQQVRLFIEGVRGFMLKYPA
ncbi:hypothetical protein [Streptomyces sp. NPDC048669]|uniref:hypothetical protein n=1 Tax=Streptomyces sp. NPDC048669 TaxID=3155267 RepID=UPI003449C010